MKLTPTGNCVGVTAREGHGTVHGRYVRVSTYMSLGNASFKKELKGTNFWVSKKLQATWLFGFGKNWVGITNECR